MVSLRVTSLEKRYGPKSVFKQVTFSCHSTVLGIAGVNGAGKSTLLKCLSGLLKPTSGTIEWKLKDELLTPKNLKKKSGFLAPYIQLYEDLTVTENLRFIRDLSPAAALQKPEELLKKSGGTGLADSLFGELSTGQQQRVKLAAALLHDPPVLFLDEPGSNLDRQGKEVVENLVREYRENGRLVLLASNQPDELDLCDTVLNLTQLTTDN